MLDKINFKIVISNFGNFQKEDFPHSQKLFNANRF